MFSTITIFYLESWGHAIVAGQLKMGFEWEVALDKDTAEQRTDRGDNKAIVTPITPPKDPE